MRIDTLRSSHSLSSRFCKSWSLKRCQAELELAEKQELKDTDTFVGLSSIFGIEHSAAVSLALFQELEEREAKEAKEAKMNELLGFSQLQCSPYQVLGGCTKEIGGLN